MIYKKYFGHLKGVLMVAYSSDAALILGGADYDGDMVKLVTDPVINKAVGNGKVYKYNEQLRKFDRVLSVIRIPDAKSGNGDKTVSRVMDYETIRNSFSGQVGLISNYAIGCAREHYWGEHISIPDMPLPDSAMCTIYTGLEIDAAKTGEHPVLPDDMEAITRKDYFLNIKKAIGTIKNAKDSKAEYNTQLLNRFFASVPEYNENTKDYTILYRKDYYHEEKIVAEYIQPEEPRSIIDRLPYYYLKKLYENNNRLNNGKGGDCIGKRSSKRQWWTFAKSDWNRKLWDETTDGSKELKRALANVTIKSEQIKKLLDETEYGKLRQLISAYNRISKIAYDDYRYQMENKKVKGTSIGKIYNRIRIMYGIWDATQKIPEFGMTVDSLIDTVVTEIKLILDCETKLDEKVIDQILRNIKDANWHYTGILVKDIESKKKMRMAVLRTIFEEEMLSEDYCMCRLFTNFSSGGFELLELFMLHLQAMSKIIPGSDHYLPSIRENEQLDDDNEIDTSVYVEKNIIKKGAKYKEYFNVFYDIYYYSRTKEIPGNKAEWMGKIIEKCREILDISKIKVNKEEYEKLVAKCWSITQSNFFWEVFNIPETLECVYVGRIDDEC